MQDETCCWTPAGHGAEMLSPARATDLCLSQGQSSTVVLAPLVPSGQCWVWSAGSWIQALPSAAWCLQPLSWKPWSHLCSRAYELPCHKCPWIQTKANVAIKIVFNSVMPLAVPLVAAGQTGSEGGGILNTSSQAARL